MDILQAALSAPNELVGLITLVVGFLAFYLYFRRRKDDKRSSARLILQEIRYAEQRIRDHRKFGFSKLSDKFLPTNHWYANIHLFIRDLEETEIDLISRFYSQSEFMDRMIQSIGDQKISPGGLKVPTVSVPAPTGLPAGSAPVSIPMMNPAEQFLNDEVEIVEFIYNTPAIDKLRKIATKKWYQLL